LKREKETIAPIQRKRKEGDAHERGGKKETLETKENFKGDPRPNHLK